MWSIAYKTLIFDRAKFITALVGVAFSVVLVNLQAGLFIGLIKKTSALVDHCEADIWVGHRKMHNVDFAMPIPLRWLDRVRAAPGVAWAEPYLVEFNKMTLPSGGYEDVMLIGVDRRSLVGNAWNITQGDPDAIVQSDGIIVDELEDDKLEHPNIGDFREIGGKRARVVAKSRGIVGFLVAPYVFTTMERAWQYLGRGSNECSYYLVGVQPGCDPKQVCAQIKKNVPNLDVLTREQYSWLSMKFWLTRTGIGLSFGASTILGLAVGMIIVGQTLYSLVEDRLGEFGALKAMGAQESQLKSILLTQAVIMSAIGSGVGLMTVCVIERFFSTPRTTIDVPPWVLAGSCLLVFVICLISALLPYLRIRNLDPVFVLQQ